MVSIKKKRKKGQGTLIAKKINFSFVLQHEHLDQHTNINMTIQYWDGVVHNIVVNIK